MYRQSNLFPSIPVSKKHTGPFKATRIWNEIVEMFIDKMPRRSHRRQLKLYHNCFTATRAVDFMHALLQRNKNTPEIITREQAVKLLRKFLQAHIIESIQIDFVDDFRDDNQLYRFKSRSENYVETNLFDVSSKMNESPKPVPTSLKLHRKFSESNPLSAAGLSASKARRSSSLRESRTSSSQTEAEINLKWKLLLIKHLQIVLRLTSAEQLVSTISFDGKFIRQNVESEKSLSFKREPFNDVIPGWALQAMSCLATWPQSGKEAGLPQYDRFERDVFDAISRYFCDGDNFLEDDVFDELALPKFQQAHIKPQKPLLSSEICKALEKMSSLKNDIVVETLRLFLVGLSPTNRRKLQILVSFMSKVNRNVNLRTLDNCISTKELLLETFSSCIFPSSDIIDTGLNPHVLTSLLMNNHQKIFRVPKSFTKAFDNEIVGGFQQETSIMRRTHSMDTLKSFVSGAKPKFSIYRLSNKIRKCRTQRERASSVSGHFLKQRDRRRCHSVSIEIAGDRRYEEKETASKTPELAVTSLQSIPSTGKSAQTFLAGFVTDV